MGKWQDLTGQRFGKLIVQEYAHSDHRGNSYWRCLCDCGNETVVRRSHLISGDTISCGCMQGSRSMEDLSGRRFGRLVVLSYDHMGNKGQTYWRCLCDCGNERVVGRGALMNGNTSSCGCRQREANTTHGMSDTSLYHVWGSMRQRCSNSNRENYERYGGRDIDGYYPENCRWVDSVIQQNNKRNNHFITWHGETHTVAEWARLFNVGYDFLYLRIRRGNMQNFKEYFGEE